jgi:hypothetical protein
VIRRAQLLHFPIAVDDQAGWVPAGTPLASDPSLELLQGKTVKISGVVELYHGKPEIRITSKEQIASE